MKETQDTAFLILVITINDHAFFEKKNETGDFTFSDENILVFRMNRSHFTDTLKFSVNERDNSSTRDDGEKICDVLFVKR